LITFWDISKISQAQTQASTHTQLLADANHATQYIGIASKMKFSDFINTKAIRAELKAVTKEEAIRELVQSLLDAGELEAEQYDDIVAAIMKREELGSTGIGRGVAVPHTKHPSVQKLVGTVGVSEEGVDFDSLDGERVQLFFLLISPPERPGDHLRALENISRQLRDETFCRFLKQSKTTDDINQLLQEADDNQFASG
jgi:PTS system fructose-specific IIA component/PTS system nitrogen regulatory IIA component